MPNDPTPADKPPEPSQSVPEIQIIHTNVGFGIQFRLELDKTLLTLVTALFAFSMAFPPTLTVHSDSRLLVIGWSSLAISMLGGIFELHGWERFYLTFQGYSGDKERGKAARNRITFWRRVSRFAFIAGFLIGAASIGLFAIDNLQYVRPSK